MIQKTLLTITGKNNEKHKIKLITIYDKTTPKLVAIYSFISFEKYYINSLK